MWATRFTVSVACATDHRGVATLHLCRPSHCPHPLSTPTHPHLCFAASPFQGLWPCRNANVHVRNKSKSTTFYRFDIYEIYIKLSKQCFLMSQRFFPQFISMVELVYLGQTTILFALESTELRLSRVFTDMSSLCRLNT